MTGTTSKADQYALVAYLIVKSERDNSPLDKKALQKKVHLIQELGSVNTGYIFSFYTYGPYSASLAGDLDVIANNGGAEVRYCSSANRYEIKSGNHIDKMRTRGQQFIKTNEAAIGRVLEAFDNGLANELELVSTIAYLYRQLQHDVFKDSKRLLEHVMKLKPRYSEAKVSHAIKDVQDILRQQKGPTGLSSGSSTP